MNTVLTLLKREYWENRGNFAIAPLAVGGFFIIMLIFALFNTEHLFGTHSNVGPINVNGIDFSGLDFLGSMTIEFATLPLERRESLWEMGFYGMSTSFTFVMILVSFIYLLGSLYDDRKDKSILFWKSLPVSDLMTVMSKILTVLFVIPAMYTVATAVTFIVIMLIASVVGMFSGGSIWASIWEPAPFLMVPIKLYFTYIIQSLWAAPFLAWLLLVSSYTKRKPILLATLPIAIISFLEFYYYRSSNFGQAVGERVMGWVAPINLRTGTHIGSGEAVTKQDGIYNNAYSLMTLPEFWYGLVLATVMVAAAVYIRRYRDES